MHVAKTHSTHACTHHALTHEQLDEAEDLLEQWRAERRMRQVSAGAFRVSLVFLPPVYLALSLARSLACSFSLVCSPWLSLAHARSLSLAPSLLSAFDSHLQGAYDSWPSMTGLVSFRMPLSQVRALVQQAAPLTLELLLPPALAYTRREGRIKEGGRTSWETATRQTAAWMVPSVGSDGALAWAWAGVCTSAMGTSARAVFVALSFPPTFLTSTLAREQRRTWHICAPNAADDSTALERLGNRAPPSSPGRERGRAGVSARAGARRRRRRSAVQVARRERP